MAEFTAVFVGEGGGSVDIKEEDGSLDIKEEDGSMDIKEECVDEKDPLSTTSQSINGKKEHKGRHKEKSICYGYVRNVLKKSFPICISKDLEWSKT